MIQVTELVQGFRAADSQAYINTYPFNTKLYQTLFPELYTPDLSFKSIEANQGASVAAEVVAFNSRAPRKGRQLPGSIVGAIPKVEIAREKSEDDINRYRGLQNALNSTVVNGGQAQVMRQIIDWMYEDGAFVVEGVHARLEWLAKQIVSSGKVSLTIANNEGGIQTKYDVDFGIPTGNKVNAAKAWSDPTADPIADIKARMLAGRNKGRIYRYMFMSREVFEQLVANPAFQKFAASYVMNALNLQSQPSLQSANSALTSQGLPQIIVWDSYISLEGKNGTQTATTGWESGAVVFSENNSLGNTQYTMSADEFVSIGKATKTKSGITLVKTWAEEDPITVITKGVAYAIPVLNGAKYLQILKTVI